MTTATKTKKTAKATPKKRTGAKKSDLPPMPPSTKVVEINGQDCIIAPLAEYDDWLQDALLAAVAADRLKNRREDVSSLEEFEARLAAKRKKGR